MIRSLVTVFAALLGLAFGSFLNVCLSRWPEGDSVVTPRSHCRSCGRTLVWWENIPLVSWLALTGRCRTCKEQVSWRYPLVELAVAILWAIVVWQAMAPVMESLANTPAPIAISFSPWFLILLAATAFGKMLFTWMLIGLATLDAEQLWLPDIVTLPGIVLGAAVALLRGDSLLGRGSASAARLLQCLNITFAILAAAGLVLLIRWIYWLIRRREGIGLGDAKLMAMLAAWLALPGALLSFGIGVVLGAVFALAMIARPKAHEKSETWALTKLPLGTFLCIGGIVSALWGQPIISAYLRWAGF
jgi:leader peptidase (prepilin peptidase)/N-methyltransferase